MSLRWGGWAILATFAAALALPSAAQTNEGWRREGASLRHGKDFRFTLTGYIQEDFRSFHDWDAGDEDTGLLRSE